jgi:uncharacterized RDD family membrane protein YckC
MEESNSILDDIKIEEIEAPYFQRLITTLFDILIEISMMVAFYVIFKEPILKLLEVNSYMRYIITLIIIFAYRLVCILLFGKTIGMIISKVKYLNNNLQPLSSKERLIAVFATKTSNIKYYKA